MTFIQSFCCILLLLGTAVAQDPEPQAWLTITDAFGFETSLMEKGGSFELKCQPNPTETGDYAVIIGKPRDKENWKPLEEAIEIVANSDKKVKGTIELSTEEKDGFKVGQKMMCGNKDGTKWDDRTGIKVDYLWRLCTPAEAKKACGDSEIPPNTVCGVKNEAEPECPFNAVKPKNILCINNYIEGLSITSGNRYTVKEGATESGKETYCEALLTDNAASARPSVPQTTKSPNTPIVPLPTQINGEDAKTYGLISINFDTPTIKLTFPDPQPTPEVLANLNVTIKNKGTEKQTEKASEFNLNDKFKAKLPQHLRMEIQLDGNYMIQDLLVYDDKDMQFEPKIEEITNGETEDREVQCTGSDDPFNGVDLDGGSVETCITEGEKEDAKEETVVCEYGSKPVKKSAEIGTTYSCWSVFHFTAVNARVVKKKIVESAVKQHTVEEVGVPIICIVILLIIGVAIYCVYYQRKKRAAEAGERTARYKPGDELAEVNIGDNDANTPSSAKRNKADASPSPSDADPRAAFSVDAGGDLFYGGRQDSVPL